MSVQAPPYITDPIRQFVGGLNDAWRVAGYPSVTVTSWFRDSNENATVGGMPNSQHLTGTAIDILPDAAGNAFAAACRQMGLVPVNEASHWHIQLYRAAQHPAEIQVS